MQARRQRPRQQVGQREQAALVRVENEDVLDGLVSLAVFQVAEVVAVLSLEQDAREGVQEDAGAGAVGASAKGLMLTARWRRPSST